MNAASASIKCWPRQERPRELLLEMGPDHVSDAGLLAVLFQTGLPGKDAVSLARELIQRFGGFRGLFQASLSELREIKGLGPAKIAKLLAALAIAQRAAKEELLGQSYDEKDASLLNYLSASMRDSRRECFQAVFIDKAGKILSIDVISTGTIDETAVYPREIIRRALELNACGIVFIHNHPAGSLKPSQHDLAVSERLEACCFAVDIPMIDHLLVSPMGICSLRKQENS
jgi:DNA repair protein RadC